jgi:hypothetical protein
MELHLDNPTLVDELVRKLSPSLKLRWAEHIGDDEPDLITFDDWLDHIAGTVCRVLPRLDLTVFERKPKVGWKEKAINQRRVNTSQVCEAQPSDDGARSLPTMMEATKLSTCLICKGDCVTVPKCDQFLNGIFDQKWQMMRDAEICRQCLKKHVMKRPYRCNDAVKGTVDGCVGNTQLQ